MNSATPQPSHILGISLLFLLFACAPASDGGEDSAGSMGMAESGGMESRIEMAPTADDALPAAILGTAPAPRGENVHYMSGDESTRGYLAVPDGEGPFPALVLIHEWNGLVDRVRQVADAMAEEGYVALAADLFPEPHRIQSRREPCADGGGERRSRRGHRQPERSRELPARPR